jgi:phage tail-like protein
MAHSPTYRFLNLEHSWPLFQRQGLEIADDGALHLARLPQLAPVGSELLPLPGIEGPVGIGADECGNVYVADPARHRILQLKACADDLEPLPCLRGPGTQPGELHSPRGVAVGANRRLYIADSRNARIVVIDLNTQQLRAIWDGLPESPFAEPWDLAVDRRGRVYVADPGTLSLDGTRAGGSLRRLDARGRADAAFAATLAAQDVRPLSPAGVTVALLPEEKEERLLVLDARPARLLAYQLDGQYDPVATQKWSRAIGQIGSTGSVAFANGVLYITDPGAQRVLAFDTTGAFLGVVGDAPVTAAGLGVDCHGRLLIHPGGAAAVRRALELPLYATCGTFLAGPFRAFTDPTNWQRLRIKCDPLPPGVHFRIYTLTSDLLDGSPGAIPVMPADCSGPFPGVVPPETLTAAALDTWRAAPRDAADLLSLNTPGEYLWIAGVLAGDGSATPVVRQIELHHDEAGWLQYLPALYQRSSAEQPFLRRALALFESGLDDLESKIDSLPRLFDAYAAPDHKKAPWLEWLAGWVDVPLDERWSDALRRRVIAEAFVLHARRGTRASLRRLIELYAGVHPFITEAHEQSGVWLLGETSGLGFESRLAPFPPGGAVLANTAVVDHSHIDPEEFGAPLFDATAHLFFVSIYGTGENGRATLDRVRRVLEREKPAHTIYHSCLIEPRMRVGVQARLGIDAIVATPNRPVQRLGAAELGQDSVLAGSVMSSTHSKQVVVPATLV